MARKISRVELLKSDGGNSDSGNIHIDEIQAYDKNGDEILDNDFINNYNRGGKNEYFYQEDDDTRYNQIISEIANSLNISEDIIE